MLILGAGTGGVTIASMLAHRLNLKDWSITLIDQGSEHVYQPGLLFLPLRLYGYEQRADVARDIREPLPPNVSLIQAEVKAIDGERKRVETDKGPVEYDWLVSSLGCRVAPEEVAGMAEAWDRGVHGFYTLDQALAFQQAMDKMQGGRLVIDIAEMPIKCPTAPIELAFLAEYYFQLKGIRHRVDITLVTPYTGAFTKPVANKVLSKIAEEKGIHIVANFAIEGVDADKKVIRSYEGTSLEYDLLCAIPPNLGPQAIEDSGLGDGSGYALTDPRTLKSRKADYVYFIGDNSNVATSKAGSVAHFEAETVVENLLLEIEGKRPRPTFDGHANCFIETGFHKAMLIDFNYDVEPLPGVYPMPCVGPFSLLKESYVNHMGKIAFKWVYWNMLLPGYLPKVPLLPSHMNFMGKDITKAPEVRRSQEMLVRDVMSKNVITVRQGSALHEAAKLLSERKVSSLPVVDIDERLVGIVTEADFLAAMNVSGDAATQRVFDAVVRRSRVRKPMGTIVDDIMTKRPVMINEEDTLQRAVHLMNRHGIKRLVITDADQKVKGIISRADLMRLFRG